MIVRLTPNSGNYVDFECDFAVFEPECVYLCNGDINNWHRDSRYNHTEIVARITDVETHGRRYWAYKTTWYSDFSIVDYNTKQAPVHANSSLIQRLWAYLNKPEYHT